jgi:hypothetical protein
MHCSGCGFAVAAGVFANPSAITVQSDKLICLAFIYAR